MGSQLTKPMQMYVDATGGCRCGGKNGDPHRRDCVAKAYFIVVFGVGPNLIMSEWLSKN